MSKPSHSHAVDQVSERAPASGASSAFTEASDQSRAFFEMSLKTWTDQGQNFLDAMAKDGAAALKGLQHCKSPLDLFTVEQNWLQARSKAYMEAGMRLLSTNLHEAEAVATGSAPTFRLPE